MTHFKTLSDFHRAAGLPPPQHPLISAIDVATVPHAPAAEPMLLDFYCIAAKRMHNVRMHYGQQPFDFNEGVLSFLAPRQVFRMAVADDAAPVQKSGWALYVHPDFLWNTPLARSIRRYDFWDYSLHEALFLSAAEEAVIVGILQAIEGECRANIDRFSKPIIVSHLENLLAYADRYYHRQFLTREKAAHGVLDRLNDLLDAHFDGAAPVQKGLPTVQDLAAALHLSPKYLSSLLRTLTGQSTQQHIHDKLIEKAKEKLSTSTLSVSEIAYELGFGHLQSFSKLFKAQTALSPLAFRASFR